jgi:predicted N-acetyltransferase YhbS
MSDYMGIMIRTLQKKDLYEVSDMKYDLEMMFYPEDNPQRESREKLYVSSHSLNPCSPLEILVAEIDEKIVGYIRFIKSGTEHIPFDDAIYIGELYVKPDNRRQGVGTALIQTIVKWAREKPAWSAKRIIAYVGNIGFYEGIGFVPMKNPKTEITKEKVPLWSHELML